MTILETQNLTKRYRGREAVRELSLSVSQGDIFGFLGRNGAGKSTTIRMVLGLVRPSSGTISLLGHEMPRSRSIALAKVGAIIESPAFYDNFSGRENLKMFAAMSGGAHRGRIEHVLNLVGLRDRAQDPVRIYSHGMRQRLGIAQALLPNPKFIILDEPTDGLDPQGILEIRLLIRKLRDEFGLTVMLSSHLLYEVEQICNRVAIIESGGLIFQGDLGDLLTESTTTRIGIDRVAEGHKFLLTRFPQLEISLNGDHALYVKARPDEISSINAVLVGEGFLVSELSPQKESLEQIFFRLTRQRTGDESS
jgi:ABC-2 type transport system ATP-binding protein